MRWLSPIWLTVASLATLGLGASCHLVGGTDGLFIEELGGSSGGTGGSSNGTGGSSGGSSSTSGTGGSGAAGCVASECPGEDTQCAIRACINGNCELVNEPPGTPCDTNFFCNGAGTCVECIENGDCIGLCQDNQCVEASCSDQEQNNGETDVDCGGPCGGCANLLGCSIAADCLSGVCSGSTCSPCEVQPDCVDSSKYCDVPSGVCVPEKAWGSSCSHAFECDTGNCCWIFGFLICSLTSC